MNEATVKRFWQPNYLLPFKVTDKQGRKNFETWLSNKWLAPSKLKKSVVSFNIFKGVYLPFWTYDAATRTNYTGERGVIRRENFKNNKGEIKERIITDWYAASGNVSVAFDDVLVPASKTLPSSISNQLTNWDMANCVAYQKEFLAGFVTELYQHDFRVALDEAKKIMATIIESHIRKNIGGDKQKIKSKNTIYNNVKFKHLLLPVWISAFMFDNKLYQFVVNGRTGQVIGDYPKSMAKIVMLGLAIIAMIAGLYYFSL